MNFQDCTGSECGQGICGGVEAFCRRDDGTSDPGPSVECDAGLSYNYKRCSAEQPTAVGGTCVDFHQCEGLISCNSGVCGGEGSGCTPPNGDPYGNGLAPTQYACRYQVQLSASLCAYLTEYRLNERILAAF
jgi:hypothetical protein